MIISLGGDLQGDCANEIEWLRSHVSELPLALRRFCGTNYPDAYVRRECLKSLGVEFADDSSFCNAGFTVVPNSSSKSRVRIGKNVSIAPNVTCITSSNANNGKEINKYRYVRERLTLSGDIDIDDEAWIGSNATILPGVTIGRCAVIGAGCVMREDADPYGIYVGVPGRKIGDVRQWEENFEQ